MKAKEKAIETVNTTKRVINNAERFIQALALLVTVGFSYNRLQTAHLSTVYQYIVLGALVIVGLRAAVEIVKFLDTPRS